MSVVLHLIVALSWWLLARPREDRHVELVNIEVAPPPPKAEALPAEVARPPESAPDQTAAAAATQTPDEEEPEQATPIDAAIDAPARKKRADAASDAESMMVARADAGEGDGGPEVASGTGLGSGEGEGSGLGSGVPAAVAMGSGSGAPGMDTQPEVEGAPTNAGTAANLLAYFPPGHQITVLIRFDRMRKTEWAPQAEQLFKPMPDYQALFAGRQLALSDQIDTLVISSPRPRDVTATTLVGHTAMSRAQMRDFLSNPDAPIKWSASKGGMFGTRSGKLFANDKRVLLSPWKGWFVLAQPADLGGLATPSRGNIDALEAKGTLPPWLSTIRTIEHESGDDKRGPALVMTLAGPAKRYKIPDLGLGVRSLPSPERASLAMELVKQGWLVRGNIVFANEADATEFVKTVEDVKQRVTDSRILSGLLKKQHALNVVTGLSLARAGARVSYATSISIADARVVLAAAAQALDAYFAQPPP